MAIWTETFDTLSDDWTKTCGSNPTDGHLPLVTFSGFYGSCQVYHEKRWRGSIVCEYKVRFVVFPQEQTVNINFGMRPQPWVGDAKFRIYWNGAEFVIDCSTYPGNQSVSTFPLVIDTDYWFKIVEETNGDTSFYYKEDGGSYGFLCTIDTSLLSFWPNSEYIPDEYVRPAISYDNPNTLSASEVWIDEIIISSDMADVDDTWPNFFKLTFESLEAEIHTDSRSADMDITFPQFHALLSDFYKVMWQVSCDDDTVLYREYFNDTLPAYEYRYTNNTWQWVVDYDKINVIRPLIAVAGTNILVVMNADPDICGSTCEWLLRFKCNDIWVELGKRGPLSSYFSLYLDGVMYESIVWDIDKSYEYIFKITGNTCTISIDGEELYNNANFLGSPAGYSCLYFEIFRNGTTDYDLKNLCIYGDSSIFLPPPLREGDIECQVEDAECLFLGVISGPATTHPAFFFYKVNVEGGGVDDLDGIDPDNIEGSGRSLLEKSVALILNGSDDLFFYILKSDILVIHAPPQIIKPVLNPGAWYWELVDAEITQPARVTHFNSFAANVPQVYNFNPAKNSPYPTYWSSIAGALEDLSLKFSTDLEVSSAVAMPGETSIVNIPRIFDKTRIS